MADKSFDAFIRSMYEGGSGMDYFDSMNNSINDSSIDFTIGGVDKHDSDSSSLSSSDSESDSDSDSELITEYKNVPIKQGGINIKQITNYIDNAPNDDLITVVPNTNDDNDDDDEEYAYFLTATKAKKTGGNTKSTQSLKINQDKQIKKNNHPNSQDVRNMIERLDLSF